MPGRVASAPWRAACSSPRSNLSPNGKACLPARKLERYGCPDRGPAAGSGVRTSAVARLRSLTMRLNIRRRSTQVIADALICHIQARLSGVQVPGSPRHPATHRRSADGEGGSGHRTHAGPRHRPRLERPTCRRHALGAAYEARGQPGRNRRGANRDRQPAHRRGSGHMRALNALPSLYLSHPTHRRCSKKGGRPVTLDAGENHIW